MRRFLFYLAASGVLYFVALKLGFAQDDFYFLRLSVARSLSDFLNFFSPSHQQGFPFYRPLGTQVYYFFFKSPLSMHIFMLLLHAFNALQVFHLFTKLKFKKFNSNLAALIYLTSSIHFLSLVYIAATQHLLATTFSLASLNLFFAGRTLLAGIMFALALLSKESALVTPIVALILKYYVDNKFVIINYLRAFIPYISVAIFYILVRLFSGVTIQSEYAYVFDARILSTLRFYIMFLLGYFEKVQDYPIISGLSQYLLDTKPWGYLTVIGTLCLTLISVYGVITKQVEYRKVFFGVILILAGLLLYLGLPAHIFPHYLDFSLLGFIFIVLSLKSKRLALIFTLILALANMGGIYSSFRLHWSPTRSRLNERQLPVLLTSGLCQNKEVAIEGDSVTVQDLYYSLSGSNGPSVICHHDMDVYFTGVDKNIPQGIAKIKVGHL